VADEETSWAILLTYLMALGYATRSLGRVSATVTAANRFMPQVRRYVLFMQRHPDEDPAERDPSAGLAIHFEAVEPRMPGSAARLDARPGDVVWAVWNRRLDAQSLGAFCVALAGGDRDRAQRIESELFFLGRVARLLSLVPLAYLEE